MRLDESAAEGLRKMGVPEEQIDAQLARGQKDVDDPAFDFEVHEDCWPSVMFFLKVQTQWLWMVQSRPAGLGVMVWSVRAGLNYPAVESALRMEGVKRRKWAKLLADLRLIETAVLSADAGVLSNKKG